MGCCIATDSITPCQLTQTLGLLFITRPQSRLSLPLSKKLQYLIRIEHVAAMSSDKQRASSDSSAPSSDETPSEVIWQTYKTLPFYAIPGPLRYSSPLSELDPKHHAIITKLAALAILVPDLRNFQKRLLKARAERFGQQFKSELQEPLQIGDLCFAITQLDQEEADTQHDRFAVTLGDLSPPCPPPPQTIRC